MAVTHTAAMRNTLSSTVGSAIDGGATIPTGQVIIRTAGDVEVSTSNYANPAFGAPAAGVITANPIADDVNATGGTAAIVTNENRDNLEIFRGTVTASGGGGDMIISSITVNPGDTVQHTGATYTAPP